MSWEDVLKMPPIRNPRADEVPKNDNLSMKEYEKLFEEIVDPIIESAGKRKKTYAFIDTLEDLDMSREKALEVANKLYENMGYEKITLTNRDLVFYLE
tara:strand:- start:55 stop:348 length:294 start_codon:yes stop_codon:yes gene_type:complete